ncbi:MAG TPA: OsmC family protein [Propionicimonas sp.]
MNVVTSVNGVDLDRLSATIGAIVADPALGRFEFRARNRWIDGGHSRATVQGFFGAGEEDSTREKPFVFDVDEPPVLLGQNLAANAGEYALAALASCLTGTIVYHAAARGIVIRELECSVRGDVRLQGFLGLDADTRPGFDQIQVTVRIGGDFTDDQLGELATLTRFSPVRDMVANPVPVDINVVRA